jgi:bifunctional non-homologous end joining protein LigD
VAALGVASATIDSEAVWCDGGGLAIFDKLHSCVHDGEVTLYAFDSLELDGADWRPRTLEERKERLARLLAKAPPGIQYSEHLEGDGAAIFAYGGPAAAWSTARADSRAPWPCRTPRKPTKPWPPA